jgi:hypothetical protein
MDLSDVWGTTFVEIAGAKDPDLIVMRRKRVVGSACLVHHFCDSKGYQRCVRLDQVPRMSKDPDLVVMWRNGMEIGESVVHDSGVSKTHTESTMIGRSVEEFKRSKAVAVRGEEM